jgi:hypothetical protein
MENDENEYPFSMENLYANGSRSLSDDSLFRW